MWRPRISPQTKKDDEGKATDSRQGLTLLWLSFGLLAMLVAGAGWLLARSAISICVHTELGESVIGGVFTAIATSLPELVIGGAAVRCARARAGTYPQWQRFRRVVPLRIRGRLSRRNHLQQCLCRLCQRYQVAMRQLRNM